jgi:hypothetical protein
MMNEWLPYLPVILIPGILHLFIAWSELNKQCRALIFFQPFRSPGMYLWSLLQFAAPSALTIWLLDLGSQPAITYELYFDALLIGVGFVGVLNSTSERIEIKPIYDTFLAFTYDMIADRQTVKSSIFWVAIESNLRKFEEEELEQVLRHLDEYFSNDISLKEKERKVNRDKISAIQTSTALKEQIIDIKELLKLVRRHHIRLFLENIGFAPDVVQELFAARRK